jgi:uncharacterized integral membrane protein
MVNAGRKTDRKKKAGTRWISWLFGLAILVAVALFAAHRSEEQEFAHLVAHAQPAWLLIGLLLQMGTYVADALIWQRIIVRAGISRPLWSYMGLGLAKLFMDQVVPSGGMSGTLLVVRALDRRGIPRGTSMAAVVVDLVGYYAAYVAALAIALGLVWVHGDLTLFIILPAVIFAPVAAGIPTVLFLMSRGRTLPKWIQRARHLRGSICGDAEADGNTNRSRPRCHAPVSRPQLLAAHGARHPPRTSRDEDVMAGLALLVSRAVEMNQLRRKFHSLLRRVVKRRALDRCRVGKKSVNQRTDGNTRRAYVPAPRIEDDDRRLE